MERTYLKCEKNEGEFADEYVVTIPLSSGKIHSGNVEKGHFDNRGFLRVLLMEDRGDNALILLPRSIGHKEVLRINTKYLVAA